MTTSPIDLFRTSLRSLVGAGRARVGTGISQPPPGSIGKVVSDLCEPDQVSRGVFRLDRNFNPVLSRSVMMLPLDRSLAARRSPSPTPHPRSLHQQPAS